MENRCACIINPDAGRPILAPTSQYGERALTAIDIGWLHSAANDGRPISQMSCYASEQGFRKVRLTLPCNLTSQSCYMIILVWNGRL